MYINLKREKIVNINISILYKKEEGEREKERGERYLTIIVDLIGEID